MAALVQRLAAQLRAPAPTKHYLMHEWDYGDYERTVPLPAMFHGEVSASLGHGQLAVRVARSDGPASTDADPTVMTDG